MQIIHSATVVVLSTPSTTRDVANLPTSRLASDAPPMLTPTIAATAAVKDPWLVIEASHVKALAWRMVELDLTYYLPLQHLVRRVNGVKRRSAVPLFPGYMFIAGDAAHEYCRRSRFVRSILPVPDQAGLRRNLASVEIALFAEPTLELSDYRVGQRVAVTGGAFEGFEGEIQEFLDGAKFGRVVVAVSMMGRGVPVEVDRTDIEAI